MTDTPSTAGTPTGDQGGGDAAAPSNPGGGSSATPGFDPAMMQALSQMLAASMAQAFQGFSSAQQSAPKTNDPSIKIPTFKGTFDDTVYVNDFVERAEAYFVDRDVSA